MQKYHPMAIGVILDVKLYNLAPAKEALLAAIGNIPVGEDLFYMYYPEATVPLEKKGEKIQSIYYFDKIKICPNIALNQTTYILGSERDEEYRRKVIFITDHYDTKYNEQLDTVLKINKSQRFECEYFFIGIGPQDFEFNEDVKIIQLDSGNHLSCPDTLQNVLDEIFSEESHGKALETRTIDGQGKTDDDKKKNAKARPNGLSKSEDQLV